LTDKGFTGREVRQLLLTAHYRETFNFTLKGLLDARAALARLDECLTKLRETAAGASADADPELLSMFEGVMDEDLNVSGAWGLVFEWVRNLNRAVAEGSLKPRDAAAALAFWQKVDSVLGVGVAPESEIPAELNALLEQRQVARKAKDFKRADAIRDELKAKGWVIEDTPKGPRLKRL
jgi:cysteinyl-tRNA synthetase